MLATLLRLKLKGKKVKAVGAHRTNVSHVQNITKIQKDLKKSIYPRGKQFTIQDLFCICSPSVRHERFMSFMSKILDRLIFICTLTSYWFLAKKGVVAQKV